MWLSGRFRAIIAACLFCILGLPALSGADARIPDEVEKYLEIIDKTYQGVVTFQGDMTISVKLAMGDQEHVSSISNDLAWKKPAMILVRTGKDKNEVLRVSDGAKYFKFVARVNEYIVEPAPESIRESEAMHAGVLGQAGGIVDIVSSIKPSDRIRENLLEASLKKDETIDGTPCTVLHFSKNVRERDVEVDLFLEKKSGLIRKMIFDNHNYLPADKAKGNRVFMVTEEVKNIRLDQPLSKSLFSFTPPKDARKVDEFSFISEQRKKREAERSESFQLQGKAAPDFKLKDIDGKLHSLSGYRGKLVLLDFWATFCPPCRVELPFLQELAAKYRSSGIVLLTITRDNPEKIRNFLKENGLNITVLLDNDGEATQNYKTFLIPQVFLIDRKGTVQKVMLGLQSKEVMEREIKNLLGGTPAPEPIPYPE